MKNPKETLSKMQEHLAVAKSSYIKIINSSSLSPEEVGKEADNYMDSIRDLFKEYGKLSKGKKNDYEDFINWVGKKNDANLSLFGNLIHGWAIDNKKDYQVVCVYSGEKRVIVSGGEGQKNVVISVGKDGERRLRLSVGSKYNLVHNGEENDLRQVVTAGFHLISEFMNTIEQ